ncbi:hypothetical protein F5Y11DRAFT_345846 [Daldinia sp. FL1419]|nr:hypothetical protein F5Y11DRAFT_345846 [Daldinia sp. FL1419]
MITYTYLITALSALASTAWALPQPFGAVTPTPTPTPIAFTDSSASATAPPTTAFPSSSVPSSQPGFTGHCDYSYCASGSQVCYYWAGYTSWDVSQGPIPGEVATVLGAC